MTTGREYPGAARLADGRVLIAGGYVGPGNTNTAELFDPKTNTFSALAATMNAIRYGPAVAALPDGRVLIAGGYGTSSDQEERRGFQRRHRNLLTRSGRWRPRAIPGLPRRCPMAAYSSEVATRTATRSPAPRSSIPQTNTFSPGPTRCPWGGMDSVMAVIYGRTRADRRRLLQHRG